MTSSELVEMFKGMTDVEVWKYLINNKDIGITVWLDNDSTTINFDEFNDVDINDDVVEVSYNFQHFLGNSVGTDKLLTAIGIKYESV